ncbi:MAG: hypothetical protein RTU30_09195 [Candidatus Thorarchaeota archaeon]
MKPIFEITPSIQKRLDKPANWLETLGADSRSSLVQCDESYTVYNTLVNLMGVSRSKKSILELRQSIIEDESVQSLVEDLTTDWKDYLVKGHDKADYPPSLLLLLFDFGVEPDDFPKVSDLLSQMISLQDDEGRFLSLARFPKSEPSLGSNFCDTHIITEVLLRGGYGESTEVQNALALMTNSIDETSQGLAWKCEPNSVTGARGPGRKADLCPQVTLEALRVFPLLPKSKRPKKLLDTGRTLLKCWKRRKSERPYMFGHGSSFKKLRPPFFWYSIGEVVDTVSRYPELVKESSFEEMLAVILAKADDIGRFTPESVYRYFKTWSFGQKNEWSPWMTYYIYRILKRLA